MVIFKSAGGGSDVTPAKNLSIDSFHIQRLSNKSTYFLWYYVYCIAYGIVFRSDCIIFLTFIFCFYFFATIARRPPVEETTSFLNSLLASHGPNYLEKLFGSKARHRLRELGGVNTVAIALSGKQKIFPTKKMCVELGFYSDIPGESKYNSEIKF